MGVFLGTLSPELRRNTRLARGCWQYTWASKHVAKQRWLGLLDAEMPSRCQKVKRWLSLARSQAILRPCQYLSIVAKQKVEVVRFRQWVSRTHGQRCDRVACLIGSSYSCRFWLRTIQTIMMACLGAVLLRHQVRDRADTTSDRWTVQHAARIVVC